MVDERQAPKMTWKIIQTLHLFLSELETYEEVQADLEFK